MKRENFKIRFWLGLAVAVSAMLAFGPPRAEALIVNAAPTWPIPSDAPIGPPQVPALPPATDAAPPADQIADPVRPAAVCGDWTQQSNYGDRWPAGASWWEYRCSDGDYQYHNTCTAGACNAFCPDCWWETWEWTDYFYWDGSQAVFYGESYSYSYQTEGEWWSEEPAHVSDDWWDAPTTQWYGLGPYPLTVFTEGTGSGAVSSSPTGISCVQNCQASFDAGTPVTLTATADASSVFIGWSGDCSGTGACQVTMDQARSVTATFALRAFTLTVAKAGTGAGVVSSSPAAISCGTTCQASYDAGTSVTLTATPDAGSLFTGWSGDCSGSGSCHVTTDQSRSVTATFALNAPPLASLTVTCTGLTCYFDGNGSSDPESSTLTYAWDFGDGTSGSGKTVSHLFSRAATYVVTLTVTDNGGVTASTSVTVNPISLSARGYKQNGLQKADLAWSGPSGASFDIYRDGVQIATVQAISYTDNINKRGSGSYTYEVCAPATSTCSNDVSVSF